jgi:pimeloyl-ACP methyl ester carboxylesterase
VTGSELRPGFVVTSSRSGPHRVAYLEWGSPTAARTVLCVHGLTGCARDFEVLAPALAGMGYRVVAVDMAGRGDSDWLADPKGYVTPKYVADVHVLLGHLEVQEVDWIGTSMGGIIGMATAAGDGSPVRRLVLNDIGPFIPRAALQRLATYLRERPTFTDLDEAEARLRETRAPFGDLTDAQWRRMTERSTRPSDGGYRLHYDPDIAVRFLETADQDTDMWQLWDAIDCPVLVLRGEDSDLLLSDTAAEMGDRGPRATVVEVPDCGHPPPLLEPKQIELVTSWLGPC